MIKSVLRNKRRKIRTLSGYHAYTLNGNIIYFKTIIGALSYSIVHNNILRLRAFYAHGNQISPVIIRYHFRYFKICIRKFGKIRGVVAQDKSLIVDHILLFLLIRSGSPVAPHHKPAYPVNIYVLYKEFLKSFS